LAVNQERMEFLSVWVDWFLNKKRNSKSVIRKRCCNCEERSDEAISRWKKWRQNEIILPSA